MSRNQTVEKTVEKVFQTRSNRYKGPLVGEGSMAGAGETGRVILHSAF